MSGIWLWAFLAFMTGNASASKKVWSDLQDPDYDLSLSAPAKDQSAPIFKIQRRKAILAAWAFGASTVAFLVVRCFFAFHPGDSTSLGTRRLADKKSQCLSDGVSSEGV